PRDPGWLVALRRAVRARGVPLPLRALVPVQPPRLPLCRVQAGGRERSEAGERGGGCGATRRPRPDERSGPAEGRRRIERAIELKSERNLRPLETSGVDWRDGV